MKLTTICWKYFDNYLRNSSLHGLRYIRDPTISFGERFGWFVCFIGAVIFAGFSVSNIYLTQMPVTVTENPEPASISDIPFPTVTICNMNKVKRSVVNEIINNNSTAWYKSLLKGYCEEHRGLNIASQSSSWVNVLNFFVKASYSCSDIVKFCMWKSVKLNCEKWFNPILTTVGMCCAFNLMPNNLIYKYRANTQELKYNYPINVENWNQERGFEHEPNDETIPWRIEGSGKHFGLTVALDSNLDDYYCSSTESAGFMIFMYNPMETRGYPRYIPLQRECWFEIITTVKETDMDVRSIDFKDRRCYFNREKYLRFYRQYTKTNCKVECHINFTIQACGCVPFYFSRTNTEKICTVEDTKCLMEVPKKLRVQEEKNQEMCNCLSACYELRFEATSHYGLLNKDTVQKMFLKNMSAEKFVKNGAILHLYYSSSLLKKYIKKEIFGFTEFLSNTGGLLGLFLGCSILSLVEIIYYLSLKLVCTIHRINNKNSITPYMN